MPETNTQSTFEGFAIVELMGHNVMAGYVTTRYFGTTAILYAVLNEQPSEELTIERTTYVDGHMLYPGSRICRHHPRKEVWANVASLYRMTPCTEERCRTHAPDPAPAPAIAAAPSTEADNDDSACDSQRDDNDNAPF